MFNIIFLDFDGVLVTPASALRGSATGIVSEPAAVKALNYLVSETGAHLVITSTWRLEYSTDELTALFGIWGIQAGIVGVTPSGPSRSKEIEAWLHNYTGSHPIDSLVVLDDLTEMGDLSPHLIYTTFETGLTMSHAQQARDLLLCRGHPPPGTSPDK